jgi:hypothetical protein
MNVIEEYEYLRVGKAKHVFAILAPEHKYSNYDLLLIMDAEWCEKERITYASKRIRNI